MSDESQETSATNGTNGATAAKPTVEKVQMSDGRIVEFAGIKRKLLKETFLMEGGSIDFIRFDFRNGETRSWTPPDAILGRLAGHGAEQKIGDECAGVDDVDDMVLAVDEMIDRLNRGEWNVKREGGGVSGTSVLLRALVEYSKNPVEKVKAFLQGKSQAEKLALRNSSQLRPIVERLEAEKAAKAAHVDTDSLLAQLPAAG